MRFFLQNKTHLRIVTNAQNVTLVARLKRSHAIPQPVEPCELSYSATLCSSLARSSVFSKELYFVVSFLL